ncbi:uncharacterized protein LOC131331561 [Rhododendron vialii]|uniref:uncharacterized protein LOC131331561 n=1 Tax=Rhododendron vialii TaxID=182163 RepID=UPI00265F92A1|nr:uncharacterized protein LOC131331561 [Rhododendron vialii]
MMDSSETRPHRTTTTTTSLFICFTSRPSSSSSMKIPSTSPGRARDTPASLSASLSRRLKSNGSLKGGHQSPMFPVAGGGKRRGFENPEPSSPKVTCIGQVRVKTKKQGKKIRTLSRRRTRNSNALNSGGNQPESGGVAIHHRNQRWVHLPLTICEALRKGFGAEFSCLFPCRPPSCLRSGKEGRERGRKGSCGVVLVSLNEEGREREVAEFFDNSGVRGSFRTPRLILGDQSPEVDGVEERREIRERISLRRHVDDEEEEVEMFEGEKCEGAGGRLSICAPPKNALLLMRSRSDPVRVSALAARFWEESTAADKCEEEGDDCDKDEEDDEAVGEGEVVKVGLGLTVGKKVEEPEKSGSIDQFFEGEEEGKAEPDVGMVVEEGEGDENTEEGKLEINEQMRLEADEQENPEFLEEIRELEAGEVNQEFVEENQEAVADPASVETEDALLIREGEQDDALVQERGESNFSSVLSLHLSSEVEEEEEEETEESTLNVEEENALEEMEAQDSPLKVEAEEEEEEEILTQERSESEQTQEEAAAIFSSEEREEHQEREERESKDVTQLLPDCLLLMRCEPKLSMEVSKETWVCTTDFIRWLPGRPQPKPSTDGGGEPKKKKRVGSTDSNPAPYQLPRSSCSLPAAQAGRVSTAARMEQQRAVNAAVACEPLVLTRCKSEPNRTAAAKLKPESCFWKNRRLEPHSRAVVGVGAAAGVGF